MTQNDRLQEQGNQRDTADESRRLGIIAEHSRSDWNDANENVDSPSEGQLATTDEFTREAIIGGILRQLRQLQETHLAYIEAHGERLEARLADNRKHKQQVIRNMEELEKEIHKLLETERKEEKSDTLFVTSQQTDTGNREE
jgi:hypothetical protein